MDTKKINKNEEIQSNLKIAFEILNNYKKTSGEDNNRYQELLADLKKSRRNEK